MKREKNVLWIGLLLLVLFAVWTLLIQTVDVQPAGESGTNVGFAALNRWFHQITGVHMWIYTVTDWLGLVPVGVCFFFGLMGLGQLTHRRSLRKVDSDILLLGVYYGLVIAGYLTFEMIPVNYRPVLIEGRMEASYPSSTTLLVLSVMPTLVFQLRQRYSGVKAVRSVTALTMLFTAFVVIGRMVSGVHWITDIVGSVLLSGGLFCMYKGMVQLCCMKKQ